MGTKRILVSGGAGFLGSHLCERLLDKGHDVVCLDNFYTGSPKNVCHLARRENFMLIRHDVVDPIDMEIDEIYHLASPASPKHYQADPIKTFETNVMGTRNLLNLALQCGARMFLASTSEVYGNPLEHPQAESYWGNVNPVGIRSCYDISKRAAECLTMDFQQHRGVDVRIARIFNTYGPRMARNDGRVVSNLVVQALQNEPLTIYGDGKQTRSFCYVSDMIEGFIKMMGAEDLTGPVNLGNPAEVSVARLAELILMITGSESKIMQLRLPQDDPVRRKPDITQAKTILGWEPKVPLVEGIKKVVHYWWERLVPSEDQRLQLIWDRKHTVFAEG